MVKKINIGGCMPKGYALFFSKTHKECGQCKERKLHKDFKNRLAKELGIEKSGDLNYICRRCENKEIRIKRSGNKRGENKKKILSVS